jgi:uncharacterized protein
MSISCQQTSAMKYNGIEISQDKLSEFCHRHRIRKLSFFGSILREDFRPESDVDVLVEFEPGARTGLLFFTMQDELSEILGRKVDLNTEGFLSRYFRDQVLTKAEVLYDAT